MARSLKPGGGDSNPLFFLVIWRSERQNLRAAWYFNGTPNKQ
jgi:hypothetical protein